MNEPDDRKTCGQCVHYEPYRNTYTNRIHPSCNGKCGWKPNIVWPMAFRRECNAFKESDPCVYQCRIWSDADCRTCRVYTPKKQPKTKSKTETML
jgi:hypothetical protein